MSILIATALALSWIRAHSPAVCVSCDGQFGDHPEVSVCKQGVLTLREIENLCEKVADDPRV